MQASFATDLPTLGTLQKGLLNCSRQFQKNKALRRIKVVFAALVHDPEISVRVGAFVWQHAVDLVQFQGGWVSIVIDADGELGVSFYLFHASSPDIAFV